MVTTSFLVDVARAHGIPLSLSIFSMSVTPGFSTSSPSAAARWNSAAISALSVSYLSSSNVACPSPHLPLYICTNSFFAASLLSPRAAMQKLSISSMPYLSAIFRQLFTTNCSESSMTPSISNTTALQFMSLSSPDKFLKSLYSKTTGFHNISAMEACYYLSSDICPITILC